MPCPVCHAASESTEGVSVCPVCKHIWQTGLAVKAVYDAKYIRERYDVYPTTEAISYLRLGLVKAFIIGGRLLDIGYGNGCFLKKAAKAGFVSFGSDVHGADYGIREISLREAADSPWDVVTFFDSLEHFSNLDLPREVAARARVVVVSIPCRPDSFPASKEWKHYRPGEHLHYFSRYSLERLFSPRRKLVSVSDVEDVIRGKLPAGEQNILTLVFVNSE